MKDLKEGIHQFEQAFDMNLPLHLKQMKSVQEKGTKSAIAMVNCSFYNTNALVCSQLYKPISKIINYNVKNKD